jgi:energy-coupling factor transporter ATP-binding protein EcfA2
MPDLINTEEEQFQVLSNLLPTMSQTSPFWARMLLQASSLRDKDKYIKQLDALPKGPQIQPKMTISAQLDNMSPPERAYLYQQMGAENVAQMVMQENRPTSNMIKLQSEQMKLQAAQAKIQAVIQQAELKLRTEQASAELKIQVEQAKAQAETIKSKLEIVLAQMDLEKQKLEIEKAELAVEKAEIEVEKAESQAKTAEKKSKESKDD